MNSGGMGCKRKIDRASGMTAVDQGNAESGRDVESGGGGPPATTQVPKGQTPQEGHAQQGA